MRTSALAMSTFFSSGGTAAHPRPYTLITLSINPDSFLYTLESHLVQIPDFEVAARLRLSLPEGWKDGTGDTGDLFLVLTIMRLRRNAYHCVREVLQRENLMSRTSPFWAASRGVLPSPHLGKLVAQLHPQHRVFWGALFVLLGLGL
ncbi:hypothetical protein C8J57DRAFT_156726 [Mycena rebaudengoi]|nr:hypothetical protein C8J57DRAFT_156726 [Mycena rebaudengoi]